jgi:hypothetical protein
MIVVAVMVVMAVVVFVVVIFRDLVAMIVIPAAPSIIAVTVVVETPPPEEGYRKSRIADDRCRWRGYNCVPNAGHAPLFISIGRSSGYVGQIGESKNC